MNNLEFNKLVTKRINKIKETLFTKGKEYSSVDDRLSNFKVSALINAQLSGGTKIEHPCDILHGYLTKHLASYFDMLNKIKNGEQISTDLIDEKFTDILNYFLLQEALMVDLGCTKAPEPIPTATA